MDEDHFDILGDQLGKDEESSHVMRHHATALPVIEKEEDGSEKVSVSGIDRQALRQKGSVMGEYRLM